MSPGMAWLNGATVPREEARVSIDDFGFRYGAACFETMLARHGRVFRLDAHLDRLERGVAGLRATPPARDLLRRAIDETLAANALTEASVRLTVTPGSGHAPDLDVARDPNVVVTADALGPPPSPARLRISTVRVDQRRSLRSAKHAQFLPYLLARAEAHEAGADDALMLDRAGRIAEGATANVFLVQGQRLVTPSLESGALPGVTRAVVLELAQRLAIVAVEEDVTPSDLGRAGAVFLTSSVAGLRPVASIEGAPPACDPVLWRAPETPHPLVERLQKEYEALVERECAG
ncbi:MAG: branched-chain amino acid aminotransferase [Chloroflexota bacterium]